MSNPSDSEFDLEQLFLPTWAKESPAANRYAKYQGGGDDAGDRRGGDRGRGGDRRGPGGGDRRGGPGGGRGGPGADRRPGGPSRFGGERRGGPPGDRRGGPSYGGDRREESRPAPVALPNVEVSILPEEKGVESLARQIKLTGRAYPLFDIAYLVLKKPERYTVRFETIKKPDGGVQQPLFGCNLDDTLWLSEQDAVNHVLHKHFATFYQAERTPTDPPKGTYTFVAQCGMSGLILGPPNYHDYQNKLHRLHTERFSRVPFEAFKARVKIVRDEAVVKKWVEDQSWKTEFVALNVPEAVRFPNREEVEKHFRQTHLANIIKPVDSHQVSGPAAQELPSQPLRSLYRHAWDDQMRFPLKVVTILSQLFAGYGLQFFKVNKSVTHTAIARPHFLDMTLTPVSDGVKRIIEFVNATEKCTRRKIIDALAPSPIAPPVPAAPAAPAAPVAQPAVAGEAAAAPAAPAPAPEPTTTPAQSALIADLHWLIHQGHVIEFANGLVETAKKPLPKPSKPAPKPKPAVAAAIAPAPAVEAAPESPATPPEPVAEAAPASESPATPAEPVAEATSAPESPTVAAAPASETPAV